MNSERVGIIVLAAGQSRRYGAPKLALPVDGVALVRRVVQAALRASAHVIVVTGAHAEHIEPLLAGLETTISFNPDWALGAGHSVAHGVARVTAIAPTIDAALIALADQYRVGAAQFSAMCDLHATAPGNIIAASYGGAVGAPCLFPRAYFDELIHLRGSSGAQPLLHTHAPMVRALLMPEAEYDIDTPFDYAAAMAGIGS